MLTFSLDQICFAAFCGTRSRLVGTNFDFISLTFQTMENLKKENQKLKDENGALIRVISKLSK
jgi:cell division protein FtsB